MRKSLLFCSSFVLGFVLVAVTANASDWQLIGPEGGDVRSLSYDPADPSHILLGTSAGQLFVSHDSGASWAPAAHLGPNDDYVLDHIIFDPTHPATIFVAAWSLFNNDEGDIFRSDDAGQSWRALKAVHGKSVRAMTMAPSDHNLLVIGSLDGVFRSHDAGETWEQISPDHHSDIKNIESVAIDPQDPDIIYAGTFHLPWKTEDGGKNWHSITEGWLLDSDVFSIIIDPKVPTTVFASACSGIYKSINRGEVFSRIRGIPHSAIRTRVLKQDPARPEIVYAGTTGGLWKTFDGGTTWELYSAPDLIVNDILINPREPDHVLLATDRGGVLASTDGFDHYVTSNRGFAHRVVGAVIPNQKDPNRLFVGVMNDKNLGGFFYSDDAGKSWKQSNRGLDERDILSLRQAPNGAILAGTNHGVFYLSSLNSSWVPATMIRGPVPEWREKAADWQPKYEDAGKGSSPTKKTSAKRSATTQGVVKPKAAVEAAIPPAKAPRVRSIAITDKAWFAATNEGLFISIDQGRKWYGEGVDGEMDFLAVDGGDSDPLTLVSIKRAFLSKDEGKTWSEVNPPRYVTILYSFTATPNSQLWLGTREGGLRSTDGGKTWEHLLGGLPPRDVFGVRYDEKGQRLLATAVNTHAIFESKNEGHTWSRTSDTGVSIRAAMTYQGRLLVASTYNGLLLEQGSEQAVAAHSGRPTQAASVDSR